ncbi:MAG: putative integral rane protein [Microbacterium sp.]|uniref:heparan-alpha-glucosaminide N-acetyltransferase domain-containing protein n=1 Tax=Microbacterium sp. TaxID=51671 RepID=UPI00262BE15F|nr:heparan-alpha-glucosaminide N-acetyltransferase domain-containing protein [Microbacterium sp.]MDF2560507.1 putative integral rane protein [Microbacterium sp.]
MTPPAAAAHSRRVVGLDLFRTIAVFGMLVAHVGPAAWTAGEGWGTVHVGWVLFHSRMPAMFAFAAGVSLTLGSPTAPDRATPETAPTVIRAALLAVCGGALAALGTPVAVILTFFSVWFLLVLPFRRCTPRTLVVAAAVWALIGPPLSVLLRRMIGSEPGFAWSVLVAGDYPALTWVPFVLAGFAVGRFDLTRRTGRRALAVVGTLLTALAYGGGGAFLALGGVDALAAARGVSGGGPAAAAEVARVFYGERGVTDTSSLLWLLVPAPHSGSWADVVGCLGVSALLLSVCLTVGDAAQRARAALRVAPRLAGIATTALAAPGAMVLSVYAAHIVAMALITATTGHSFGPAQSIGTLAAFTMGLTAASVVWSRFEPRGPLEWALGRVTLLIVRMGRRASAGWSRPSRP